MKNLHFTKVNKNWFYTFNSTDKTMTFTPPTPGNLNGWIEMPGINSKAQAIAALKVKFPDSIPSFSKIKSKPLFRTPFQKKEKYRNDERNFKNGQNEKANAVEPEDEFEEYYD